MEHLHALLQLFGERYIFTDKVQAALDLKHNRDQMVTAFEAILLMTEGGENNDI